MPRHQIANHRPGFTLVELLVVIGILALLMSMLLPSLARARARAREVHCANSLRQVSAMCMLYANDNRGTLFIEPTEHNPHPQLIAYAQNHKLGTSMFYCWEYDLMDNVAQSTMYQPVGATDSVAPTDANLAAGNIGYVYFGFLANKKFSGVSWREPTFIPRVLSIQGAREVDPTRRLLPAPPAERWLLCDFWRKGAPFPHGRSHARGINVAFLDSHVEMIFGSPKDNYR